MDGDANNTHYRKMMNGILSQYNLWTSQESAIALQQAEPGLDRIGITGNHSIMQRLHLALRNRGVENATLVAQENGGAMLHVPMSSTPAWRRGFKNALSDSLSRIRQEEKQGRGGITR